MDANGRGWRRAGGGGDDGRSERGGRRRAEGPKKGMGNGEGRKGGDRIMMISGWSYRLSRGGSRGGDALRFSVRSSKPRVLWVKHDRR